MRRRLDLAAAFILRPEVLFLDEPTTGLDPAGRREVWDIVRGLVADGTTVLLTTQYLDEAAQLADEVCVLSGGRVVVRGTPDELTAAVDGDRVELVLPDASRQAQAVSVAHHAVRAPELLRNGLPSEDPVRVTVPVPRRRGAVGQVLRALDDAGIAVDDVVLRPTTLDEAYLRITADQRPTAVSA
jgi:ABC-2 type transport system ATP-binding protein